MTKKTQQMLLLAGAGIAVYFLFFKDKKEAKVSVQLGDVKGDVEAEVEKPSESSFDDGFSS
jgi:hypothetical protein